MGVSIVSRRQWSIGRENGEKLKNERRAER